MSRQHLSKLVQAYLRLPGAQPGGWSPDDAFTVLSPIDGRCVAIDWCAVDDTALICAHPFEGRNPPDTLLGASDEEHEAVDDLGHDGLGQWWWHEDRITGRTTLALRAPLTEWGLEEFSHMLDVFCRQLDSMCGDNDMCRPAEDSQEVPPVAGDGFDPAACMRLLDRP